MKRFVVVIIIIVLAIVAMHALSRPEKLLERSSLDGFPKIISGWKCIDNQAIDDKSMEVLLVDDYTMSTYINEDKDVIGLYIGYFTHQREGKQVHSPRQCLPGAGWKIDSQEIYWLDIPGGNKKVPVNLQLMNKGGKKRLYLWWYQGRGRIYAGEYWNKFYLMLDAVTKNRTDGALVRVDTMVASNLDERLELLDGFIQQIIPLLSSYIPE